MLPLQEHPLLLGAGQAAGQPGGQGAGRDACGGEQQPEIQPVSRGGGPFVMSALTHWLTQTGQRHGGQVDGLHGVGPLVQRPHELEVEDAADQAADAAGGEEDHLGGGEGGAVRRAALATPADVCGAGRSANGWCACSSLTGAPGRRRSHGCSQNRSIDSAQ